VFLADKPAHEADLVLGRTTILPMSRACFNRQDMAKQYR
jgi:hypothetical protein